MGQLNELQIKAAAPRDKEYLLADGEGLYLRVRPTGKVWVYRYKQLGKEAKLSLGHYPGSRWQTHARRPVQRPRSALTASIQGRRAAWKRNAAAWPASIRSN